MSETAKRTKVSTEPIITDIAESIESITESLTSINKSHANLLRLNKAVVALKLDIEKEKKPNLDTTVPISEGK